MQHSRALCRPRRLRRDPWHRRVQDQGHPERNRGRLRRQDFGLSRARRHRSFAQVRTTRQDGHDAGRGVSRDWSDLGHKDPDEARRQARRHVGRRQRLPLVRGRRLQGLTFWSGRHVLFRLLQHPELLHRSLRRAGEQAESGRLSRARLTNGLFRGRVAPRRDLADARVRSDRDSSEERRQGRRPGAVRSRVRADWFPSGARSGPGASALARRARAQ